MKMQNHLGQELKAQQKMMLSPQMQEAMKLLQVPNSALLALIEHELEQNPLLEINEALVEELDTQELNESEPSLDFDELNFEILGEMEEAFGDFYQQTELSLPSKEEDEKLSYRKESIVKPRSNYEVLIDEARESFNNEEDIELASLILGNLDDNGYLSSSLSEIAELEQVPLEKLKSILLQLQDFDPPGICARDRQESLLIQLKKRGRQGSLAFKIIKNHYEDFLNNHQPKIAKALGVSILQLQKAIEVDIRHLDLHPLSKISEIPIQIQEPDLYIYEREGKLQVDLRYDDIPELKINEQYASLLNKPGTSSAIKEFIETKLTHSKNFLKNLRQRNDTLKKLGDALLELQYDFFYSLDGKLKPMTMKEVADQIGVHESTVARAVSEKSLFCDRGLIMLKDLFTSGCETDHQEKASSYDIKGLIEEMITSEDKYTPLSDQSISEQLEEKGIHCARRTVAKYRYQLNLASASKRRIHKKKAAKL